MTDGANHEGSIIKSYDVRGLVEMQSGEYVPTTELHALIKQLAERDAEVDRMKAENEALRTDARKAILDETFVLSMNYHHLTGGEVTVASPFMNTLAEWIARDLGDAPNFMVREFSVTNKERAESYVVTVQRRGKLTPEDRYLDVCKERTELQDEVASLRAKAEKLDALTKAWRESLPPQIISEMVGNSAIAAGKEGA